MMTSSIPLKMLEGKFEKGKKNLEHVVGQRVSILLPICTVRTQNSLGGLLVLLHCFAAATDSLPHFLLIFGVVTLKIMHFLIPYNAVKNSWHR